MLGRHVYVCWSEIWSPGILKIGETGNVAKRMKSLRATPLLVLVGGRDLEGFIHRRISERRVRDEHFVVDREMLWLLSKLREMERDAGLSPYALGAAEAFLARLGVDLRKQYPWQSGLWLGGPEGRSDRVALAIREELDRAIEKL